MAKWIKLEGGEALFNIDSAMKIEPMHGSPPYLRVWVGGEKSTDLRGVDAAAVIAHLATQGHVIDLEKFKREPQWSTAVRQR